MKAREHLQQMQMQQLQLMQQRNPQMQRRDPNHPLLGGPMTSMNSDGMIGSASLVDMKMYGERMKHPQSMDANKMALMKSASNQQGYPCFNALFLRSLSLKTYVS